MFHDRRSLKSLRVSKLGKNRLKRYMGGYAPEACEYDTNQTDFDFIAIAHRLANELRASQTQMKPGRQDSS